MNEEWRAVGLGATCVVFGLALSLVPDLRFSGLMCAAAGGVLAAFGYWFIRRGGSTPLGAVEGPTAPQSPDRNRCPHCGENATRSMTAPETTAFYGVDRLVFDNPRLCLACGKGFEPEIPLFGRALMMTAGTLGMLVGLALGLVMLSGPYIAFVDATMRFDRRCMLFASPIALPVAWWWCSQSYRLIVHHWPGDTTHTSS